MIQLHRRGAFLLAFLCSVSIIASSCSTQGLNFLEDTRVRIISPQERAQVRFPLTIEWTVNGFQITGPDGRADPDSGYFGLFIDRAPQPPGKGFEWLVRDDRQCQQRPGCPDNLYYMNLNIHSLTRTSFTIQNLVDPDPFEDDRREFHEATIILMNGRGERIGESAFRVEFEVKRA